MTRQQPSGLPSGKYASFPPVDLPDRTWPSRRITKAPIWASVDLRDGNQALINPMNADRKRRMFRTLVGLGFKEIEVGFPAASQTDFDFLRLLIEEDMIPDDVTVQVLTQAREHLIRRTAEALRGAKRAIVHVYNSTSEQQRRLVFRTDRAGIQKIATDGVQLVRDLLPEMEGIDIALQYSPESFTATELDFAVDICQAVMETWGATPERPVILNLPATVEMATPNVHADQIEWFCRQLPDRESSIISLHPHNDRGSAVAATELALMAGADRVEGTLFGNGERTGNVDLVTLALNMHTQGVDPQLALSNIGDLVEVFEYCNQMPVHPRHPYAGELVYTAFSGSHQDAISKGMKAMETSNSGRWDVPYLPIDPKDVGRGYEAVVRINSQSGKGGVAYVLESDYGIQLPKPMQMAFSQVIQGITDRTGEEISPHEIWSAFRREYLDRTEPYQLISFTSAPVTRNSHIERCEAVILTDGEEKTLTGTGKGPVEAFVKGLRANFGLDFEFVDYSEHAIGPGSKAEAAAYVHLAAENGSESPREVFGCAIDTSITLATIMAVLSAVNRLASDD